MPSTAWPHIHAEREALAADLQQLTEEQWATASLCRDWTVRDALAHMTATAKTTPFSFFPKFIAAGFRFNDMSAKDLAAERGSSGADALARFTSVLGATTHPPGPLDAMVGEVAGPLASIILAITGRRAGVDDLSGDGVATLRGRLPG